MYHNLTSLLHSIFTVATISVDLLKLRELSREQKKHQYVINLTQVSEEDAATAPDAPPSYEAALRAPTRDNEV